MNSISGSSSSFLAVTRFDPQQGPQRTHGRRLAMPVFGYKLTFCAAHAMSASLIGRFGSSAFRPFYHCTVDVAHGLVLLSGIGTRALPSWDSRTRRSNLWVGLAVRVMAGPSGHAISPHPSSREGHHATVRWSLCFLLLGLIPCDSHAAATSLVHRNSVPSTQMRCMTTAKRRANATIAFLRPRRLAICSAQALSQDHFAERVSRIWAAS